MTDITPYKSYKFTVPGRAVGKESVRTTGIKTAKDGHQYISKYFPTKTTNFVATVKMAAKQAGVKLMERCLMNVEIGIPVTVKKFKTRPDEYHEPLVRPDRDNVNKSICDALTHIAYADDKHILGGETRYVWTRGAAFTRVTLVEVQWEDYIETE